MSRHDSTAPTSARKGMDSASESTTETPGAARARNVDASKRLSLGAHEVAKPHVQEVAAGLRPWPHIERITHLSAEQTKLLPPPCCHPRPREKSCIAQRPRWAARWLLCSRPPICLTLPRILREAWVVPSPRLSHGHRARHCTLRLARDARQSGLSQHRSAGGPVATGGSCRVLCWPREPCC